jgi:hypothetical protein
VIKRRRRQVDAVAIHAAHVGAKQPQERIRHVDRIVFGLPLDALGAPRGARRIQHVVTGDLVRNRRDRLGDRFPIPRAEAGQRLVEHEEQRLARLACDEPLDLFGAFWRGDHEFGAAIPHDIGDLVLGEVAADRGVIQAGALRRPADLHERQPVFHQERDVVAGPQPERAKQMGALVRKLIELAIGDRLAAPRHLIGDLVGLGPGVDGRVGHGGSSERRMASSQWRIGKKVALPLRTIRSSPLAIRPYNLSTIVTFAMPPPSHMVCRP